MAARVYFYAESLDRATTATTDYSATKVTLTFTGNANKTYAIFWSCLVDCSSTTVQARARLQNTTDSTTLGEQSQRCSIATSIKMSMGGVAFFAAGASPTEHSFAIQYGAASSATEGIASAVILALELGTNDVTNESLGTSNSVTTTYAAKTTISWTPGTAGDYLIVGSAEGGRGTSTEVKLRLFDGTTAYSEIPLLDWRSATEIGPHYAMRYATGLSGAQTWTHQWARPSGSGNATIRNARLLALRLSDFGAAWAAEDRVSHITTDVNYVSSAASITQTPAAVDHLLLACGITTGDNYATQLANKVVAAGSDVAVCVNTDDAGYYYSWFQFRKRTEAASSTTWVHQYARLAGTDTTHATDENVIAVLQLADSVSATTLTATGLTAMYSYGGLPIICPIGF